MTLRDLSEGLRELADDVETVDLHARVIRTSRRLRARRAAAVMSGGLAFVLIIVIAFSVSWHRPGPGGGLDAAEQDSIIVDASDSADPYGGADEYSAVARVGYYVMSTAAGVYGVYSWEPGSSPRLEISGDVTFAESVAISPSGQYAAYYTPGRMSVADLSGEEPADPDDVVYTAEVDGDLCLTPTWTPDSAGVVLNSSGGKSSTFVNLLENSVIDLHRPEGCDARVFNYLPDLEQAVASFAFASVLSDDTVAWVDADDGTALTEPVGYDPEVLGFTAQRLAAVNADGTMLCLDDAVDPDDPLPMRSSCSALATPLGPVAEKLPIEGTLHGAAFIDDGTVPASGGSDGANDGQVTISLLQSMVLRVQAPASGYTVAQVSYTYEEPASKEFGAVRVGDFQLVVEPTPEPPELATAHLLTFTA